GKRIWVETPCRERIPGPKCWRAIWVLIVRHIDGSAVIGEVSILDVGRGHGGLLVSAGAIAQAFVGGEVKKLVSPDSSARGRSKLVPLKGRFCGVRIIRVDIVEKVFRIQRAVAQKIISRAVKVVRASPGDRIDLRGAAPKLR